MWATNEPVPDPPRVWQVLTGMHPDNGLVPILLAFLGGGQEGRPWDAGELDLRCDLAAVDKLDAASVLAQAWAGKAPTQRSMSVSLSSSPVLRSWEDRFGAALIEVGFDHIRMLVQRPPRTVPDAQAVAAELYVMCNEFWPPGEPGIAVYDVRGIAEHTLDISIWSMWWD